MLPVIARLTLLAYLCGGLLIPAIHGRGKGCADSRCNRSGDQQQLALVTCQHGGLEHSVFEHRDTRDGGSTYQLSTEDVSGSACVEAPAGPSHPYCPGNNSPNDNCPSENCPVDCVVCLHIQWHSGDLSWLVTCQADETVADRPSPSNALRVKQERLGAAQPRGPPINVAL